MVMRKTCLFLVQPLMALILVFAAGCNGEDGGGGVLPGVNKPPACSITNPQNNAQFSMDESITVTVVAEDTDGTIAEVQLYIDNVGHSAKTAFPYNFTINAGELAAGAHTLKAVAKDDQGAQGEAAVNITISQPSTESPDFVSFSDGKIPNTWQTTAWVIDNTVGYDDIYSLKSTKSDVAVITNKTCNASINYVEFYVRNGNVNFFIDGEKRKECSSGNDWTQYSLYLKEGLHTLKWESVSSSVNIDAIRFKKANFAIGMNYQGGIIAYVDNSGEHGLIAAPSDQSEGIQWYNGSYITTGATGTAIGAGQSNTTAIVQAQGEGAYAAKLCDDLVLNAYSDWFLPSRDELNILFQNRYVIGFTDGIYWSSSENSSSSALCQSPDGGHYNYGKDKSFRVRAVRAF